MIDGSSIKSYVTVIARGYLRIAKSAGSILAALTVVAGISAAVVTPLWLLATRHTELYTIVSVCGLCIAIITTAIVRSVKNPDKRRIFVRRMLRLLVLLVLAASLYLIVLLYMWRLFAAAIPLTVVYITLTGLILHGKRMV